MNTSVIKENHINLLLIIYVYLSDSYTIYLQATDVVNCYRSRVPKAEQVLSLKLYHRRTNR